MKYHTHTHILRPLRIVYRTINKCVIGYRKGDIFCCLLINTSQSLLSWATRQDILLFAFGLVRMSVCAQRMRAMLIWSYIIIHFFKPLKMIRIGLGKENKYKTNNRDWDANCILIKWCCLGDCNIIFIDCAFFFEDGIICVIIRIE